MFIRISLVLSVLLLALLAGCSQHSEAPVAPATSFAPASPEDLPLSGNFLALADTNNPSCRVLFGTLLLGANEVPPRETRAAGIAGFRLNATRDTAWYKLYVMNIKNVVGAHIHLAPKGVAGQIVVPLYSASPGGGPFSGLLASGFFTANDFTGPFAGATSFDGFVSALKNDSLYVNVHTNDGVDPANTGPGDFPGGEIRGQLIAVPCRACRTPPLSGGERPQ